MTCVQRAVWVEGVMIAIRKLDEDPRKSQELAVRSTSHFRVIYLITDRIQTARIIMPKTNSVAEEIQSG